VIRPTIASTALATLVTLAALALPAAAPRARAGDLLDQYAATDRLRSGQPRALAVAPDGREVLFLRSGPRDRVGDLYSLDTRTGAERVMLTAKQLLAGADESLTPEERARRERLRLSVRGIASFEVSPDGRRLLVPLSGRLYVVERTTGAVRELVGGGPAVADAHFSPGGRQVACVRGGDVHVIDLADGAERAVTAHEGEFTSWGSPEFVAQEEMDRFAGYWWSPSSRWLLAQYTDESKVERLHISDPSRPESPPQEWAYPRPGHTNADVRLALVPAAGGAPRWVTWDRARYPYLCTVAWSEQGPPTLVVMDREQHEEAVLAVDTTSGDTRALHVERDSLFLNLRAGAPRWLAGGRDWLWIAERDDSGPWLERRSSQGAPAARLTPPGLRVHDLLAVDDARGFAYVLASDDPLEAHVWRLPLDPRQGAARRLGADSGVETATFARTGGMHVRALRPRAGTGRWIVEDGDGRVLGAVRSVAETPLIVPGVEWLNVGADSLRACIVRPRDFDPSRRYPVIDWAYGGPHWGQVSANASTYLIPQWIADHGFVLVAIDGRGTPWRGRSWERAIRGNLIDPALADHVAGLRALCARYPQLDAERIGVTGWSFGGYFSALAVERAPQTYKAGVAGAPVVDWRDYDTFYTERYLGLPGADSLAYARSSVLTDAAKLSRPLLVIHGTADDNVYFFHSLKLADALNRAGLAYEFLPLTGETHGTSDPAYQRQEYTRTVEFLRRELGVPGDAAPQRP
jgi:dipeptidyl-peptidase 4